MVGGDIVVPLLARVVPVDNLIGAIHAETGIFGVGETVTAALNDLRAALVDHRDLLEDSGALGESLEEQLNVLRRHLRGSDH